MNLTTTSNKSNSINIAVDFIRDNLGVSINNANIIYNMLLSSWLMQLRIRYMLYSFIPVAVLKDKLRRYGFHNESESCRGIFLQCPLRFSAHIRDPNVELREPVKRS